MIRVCGLDLYRMKSESRCFLLSEWADAGHVRGALALVNCACFKRLISNKG